MSRKKKCNNFVIDKENNIAKIELRRRGKENLWTIIDENGIAIRWMD